MSAFLGGLNQWFSVKADVDEAMRAAVWGAGTLALADETAVRFGAIVLVLVMITLPLAQQRMRRLELGDDTAAALGIQVERSKVMLVVLGVVTTAVVTATAGPIAFVALAAPQIGRRLRGRGSRCPGTRLWFASARVSTRGFVSVGTRSTTSTSTSD